MCDTFVAHVRIEYKTLLISIFFMKGLHYMKKTWIKSISLSLACLLGFGVLSDCRHEEKTSWSI